MALNLAPSLALVGMLGFRHGFDADHIAAVDGMTRARQLHHSYWSARRVGLQFALGHSAAILAASLLLYGQSAALPQWLDGLGLAISTCFLLFIAASNAGHALRPGAANVAASGPVAALLFRLSGGNLHPALVGMAFAMSFDSLGQAMFFASHQAGASSIWVVALMAAVFGCGMMFADASNGALLAWFANRSDRIARQASRLSSAFIALLALLTAGAGMLREFRGGFAQAWDALGIWTGVGLLCVTSLFYTGRILLQRARLHGAEAAR